MTEVRVQFLGGPLHNEHREVEMIDGRPPSGICAQPDWEPQFTADGPQPSPDPVLYTPRRRQDGMWVYVAPDWPPAPKACVAPGCNEPARLVFVAAEHGRLAGREWNPGDEVDLCPPHGCDIYRAQGVYGVDELAEWLRPDARLDALDYYTAGSGLDAEEYADSRRHALRMRRP